MLKAVRDIICDYSDFLSIKSALKEQISTSWICNFLDTIKDQVVMKHNKDSPMFLRGRGQVESGVMGVEVFGGRGGGKSGLLRANKVNLAGLEGMEYFRPLDQAVEPREKRRNKKREKRKRGERGKRGREDGKMS